MMWIWVVLVIVALLTGACAVAVLAVGRRAEPVFALLGLLAAVLAGYTVITIGARYQRLDALGYAVAMLGIGVAGGWMLAAALLGKTATEPAIPFITQDAPAEARTAVIVAASIEPACYSMPTTAATLKALGDQELVEPSLGTLPFLYLSQKSRYRAIGGTSPAAQELRRIAEQLSAALPQDRFAPARAVSYAGEGRLALAVAESVNAGFHSIVVVELTVGETLELAEAKREIDFLRLEQYGIQLFYTGQLSSFEGLVEMLVARVLGALDTPDSTGVALVGHGQSERHARLNPGFDQAENSFLNRIRMRLLEEGLPEQHVRIAWAEWDSPDVTSAVRHLAALGCRRVLVVPAVYCVDTTGTLLDLELAVRQARVDEEVSTVTLPSWRDDEMLIAELARCVEKMLV